MPPFYRLDRRGNGVWYVVWSEGRRSKRLSMGTKSRSEAQERYKGFLNGVTASDAGSAVYTVDEAIDAYLAEHADPRTATADRSRSAFKHVRAFFGRMPADQVGIVECRRYRAARHHKAMAPGEDPQRIPPVAPVEYVGRKPGQDGTIGYELGRLSAALHHAETWKRIDKAPTIEAPPAPPAKDRWLRRGRPGEGRDELGELIAAARAHSDRLGWFVVFAYYTASRREAVEKLTRFQVDLANGTINLNPAGRRQTAKRRPVVPIDTAMLADLRAALAATNSEYVLGGDGAKLWYAFRTVADGLGLEDVTPHTLRHSRATHLLQDGRDPWAVAGLLGDSLETLLRKYGHHCPAHIRRALEDKTDSAAG